jgi:hypothetical protein
LLGCRYAEIIILQSKRLSSYLVCFQLYSFGQASMRFAYQFNSNFAILSKNVCLWRTRRAAGSDKVLHKSEFRIFHSQSLDDLAFQNTFHRLVRFLTVAIVDYLRAKKSQRKSQTNAFRSQKS